MENAMNTEKQPAQEQIDERTRKIRLIRSLVNIYRLCNAISGAV